MLWTIITLRMLGRLPLSCLWTGSKNELIQITELNTNAVKKTQKYKNLYVWKYSLNIVNITMLDQ